MNLFEAKQEEIGKGQPECRLLRTSQSCSQSWTRPITLSFLLPLTLAASPFLSSSLLLPSSLSFFLFPYYYHWK